MTKIEKAREIINRDIEYKTTFILNCMEDIERMTKRMMEASSNNNIAQAIGYADNIGRRTKDIEELNKEIISLRKQLSVIDFIEDKE